jgi:hypothetical protein
MMLRLISSIIGGLLLAFLIVIATDAAFHAIWPVSAVPPTANEPEAMRQYVAGQPVAALSAILAGWGLAVFVGSATASRFGSRGERPGQVVTGLFLLATLMNFSLVQHPTWMVLGGTALILLAGCIAARLAGRGPVVPHRRV